MSATGVDVFEKSIQTTNMWLDEIMEDMGPERRLAWHLVGAVLRTVRDRLPPDLAAHLGAQLPLVVRGAFYDRYEPSSTPDKARSLEAFLGEIADELRFTRPVNIQDALQMVCSVLAKHVDEGQILKVWEALPGEIRQAAAFIRRKPMANQHPKTRRPTDKDLQTNPGIGTSKGATQRDETFEDEDGLDGENTFEGDVGNDTTPQGGVAALIGFGTHAGQVACASDWDGEMEIKDIRPSLSGSVERLCHESGKSSFLLDFRQNDQLSDALSVPHPERYIGVIYRPETERLSHYMDSAVSRQFDAFVWFDQTTPLEPLPAQPRPGKVPDTFPFGV